jgi:hypothetical protein
VFGKELDLQQNRLIEKLAEETNPRIEDQQKLKELRKLKPCES